MFSEIEDIIQAGATVTEDEDAGVAIVTWYASFQLILVQRSAEHCARTSQGSRSVGFVRQWQNTEEKDGLCKWQVPWRCHGETNVSWLVF